MTKIATLGNESSMPSTRWAQFLPSDHHSPQASSQLLEVEVTAIERTAVHITS